MERPLPRHRARLLARHARARSPTSPTRLRAPRTSTATAGGRPRRVNLVTVHDGFTLSDLVSYNAKHNEANGEDNRDGTDDNRSWNCGVEGPTDDPAVLALRERQRRNLLATLLLSAGRAAAARRRRARPHAARQQQRLLPGQRDRAGSTGRRPTRADRVRRATCAPASRAADPRAVRASSRPVRSSGFARTASRCRRRLERRRTLGRSPSRAPDGALLVNAWWEPLTFRLPGDGPWSVELDTADPGSRRVVADTVELVGRSLALLTR